MSFVYDAVSILGLGEASGEPLPEPAPDEVVIRVGAWSLKNLRTCETVARENLMWDQEWYHEYPWSRKKLTLGVYRVRMPIPESNRKNFTEQKELLLPGEEVGPAALVAAVLLCHLKQAGRDPLNDHSTRCAKALPGGRRLVLTVEGGRVCVDDLWDTDRHDLLWLAGCRKC